MAIPKFEDDLRIISKLGDNPGTDNGYTTQEFKEAFDKAPLLIQKFINEVLIPAANASSSPEEGLSMKGPINMNGQKLSGIKEPVNDNDAVNKKYVDQKKTAQRITLRSSEWVDNCQTVAVSGVTADETKTDVIASPETSDENYTAYLDSNIRIVEQLDGAVTFKCEYVPSIDLTVNVMVMR